MGEKSTLYLFANWRKENILKLDQNKQKVEKNTFCSDSTKDAHIFQGKPPFPCT